MEEHWTQTALDIIRESVPIIERHVDRMVIERDRLLERRDDLPPHKRSCCCMSINITTDCIKRDSALLGRAKRLIKGGE